MQPSDHRANARAALSGNWGVAVLVSLLAGIIGGGGSSGVNLNFNLGSTDTTTIVDGSIPTELGGIAAGALGIVGVVILIVTLAVLALNLVLGGVMQLGEARYNLNLIDRKEAVVNDLFSQFPRFRPALVMNLLSTLYITLWTLLFIVPGIVASYSYAMAPYILLEDPNCTGSEALTRSKEMMEGHKADLFWLDLSFIGWSILCSFTMGIGNLWLNPYTKASRASFYRNLQKPYTTVE